MRKNKGNSIRLGLFVLISLVLLVTGIYYIGQRQHMFSNTFRISGVFKDISGLLEGNNVRVAGINVGVVDNIEQVTDSTVKVEMLIEEKTRKFIKKDALGRIGSDGLMGNKIVTISPGNSGSKVIEDNDVIKTVVPVAIDDILSQLKVTTENSAKITNDLSAITSTIRSGEGTIGKLFMDTTFAKTIEDAMVNIKMGAGGFKRNMDAASHSIFLRGKLKRKQKK